MKLHLPKMLLTAVLSIMGTAGHASANEVWVNFGHTAVGDSTWNDITGSSAAELDGTYTLKDTEGNIVGSLTLDATDAPYQSGCSTDTPIGKMQKSYLDYQGNNEWNLSFFVDDIGASNITLNAYHASDNSKQRAPLIINGTAYAGGTDNASDAAWGAGVDPSTVELGEHNTVTVTGLSGIITMTPKDNGGNNDSGRFTMSGLSFTWDGSSSATGIELNSGVNEAASYLEGVAAENRLFSLSGNADNTSSFNIAGGETLQGLQAAANTVTITSDGAISTSKLWAKNGATLNLNAALAENTALSVGGMGTVNINASQTLASLSSLVATLGIGSNSTVTVNGAASFAGVDVAGSSTLALNGSVDGTFILNATGSGTIELNNSGTVIIPGAANGGHNELGDGGTATNINTTAFKGVISVKSGTLSLGDNGGSQRYWALDLGSLKSIDLDGGSMRLFGAASTISTINVNKSSDIVINQASVTQSSATGDAATTGVPGYRINNLVLNDNLSVQTSWRSVVEIGTVSGAADISMYTDAAGRVLSLYINEVDATAGMNMNFAANVNATLGGAANSELTDVSHTLGGTITNAANLTVNGSITIVDDLSAFLMLSAGSVSGELSVNGTDGYMTTNGSTYLLVDNTGSGTVNFSPTTATYAGSTINLTQDATTGDVTFVGGTSLDTIYRVNTADVTVGSDDATVNRATSFIITSGRTVTIAGASDTATTSAMLYNSTGAGNVILTADASLAREQITQATGKLTISGATLNLGDSDLNATDYSVPGASISSFTAVELDNGTIYVNNPDGTIKNLSVTAKGGTIDVFDLGQHEDNKWLTLAETTTLNGDLNLKSTYNTQIAVTKLDGTGNVVINDTREELMVLDINGKDAGYSGQVQVKGNANNLKVNVTENLGLDVHVSTRSGEMNLTGIGAGNKIILQGASGSVTSASTLAANVQIENTGNYAGMEITSATDNDILTYSGTVTGEGNYIIVPTKTVQVDGAAQKVSVSTTTKFTGDTSGWTGKLEALTGTQNVIFSGSEVINNSEIQARHGANVTADAPVLNLTISHASSAVTVNSLINQKNGYTTNLTVNTAKGATTFTKDVTVSSTTLEAGTVATFNSASSLGSVTLGAGASITGTGNLSITELLLNLETYTTDYANPHVLVSTTGTLTFTGDLSGYQNVQVGNYTTELVQSETGITLKFNGLEPSAPLDATVIAYDLDGTTLTLTLNTSMTGYDSFNIVGFEGDLLERLRGEAAGMVSIQLTDGEIATPVAGTDAENVGFYGSYYGQLGEGGVDWVYDMAYIPEPATATLSLLALAGLAARRRRKH